MKADIGFLQELQPDGKISNSFVRKLSAFFFILLVLYMIAAKLTYIWQFEYYTRLLDKHLLSQETFLVLVGELKEFNWDIFLILVVATVAPKVVQKFAEARTGVPQKGGV